MGNMLNRREKAIKKLVDIGLNYNVDYIYILQDIESILSLKKEDIDLKGISAENYIDY